MTRYELACDKRVTLAAIISESAMIVACVLLADAALEHFSIQTMMASHVSLQAAIIVVIAIQYVIATIEIVASYRDDNRGATIPIAFVPGGIILRFVLMVVAIGAVVALKLLVYFLSVLTAFATQILRIDKWCSTAKWVDFVDRFLEPIEYGVNRLYNWLYFNKIRANSSVFTSMFNGSLSFWCINH
ncbi:MAG: hypothetical protein KIG72_08140 [Bradymonadales bacterium]|nr:hypothetical protein [Bradymonadales bacterium]